MMNSLQAKWRESVASYEENSFDPSEKIERWKAFGVTREVIPLLIQSSIDRAKTFHDALDFKPGDKILDLACGNGYLYGFKLSEIGYGYLPSGINPIGIDVIPNNQYPGVFSRGNAGGLPFKDSVFDGAVCVSSLNHFLDPVESFHEVLRVLKPRGSYFISSETLDIPMPFGIRATGKHHIFDFSPMAILNMYWDTGFRNIGYIKIYDYGNICVFWGSKEAT